MTERNEDRKVAVKVTFFSVPASFFVAITIRSSLSMPLDFSTGLLTMWGIILVGVMLCETFFAASRYMGETTDKLLSTGLVVVFTAIGLAIEVPSSAALLGLVMSSLTAFTIFVTVMLFHVSQCHLANKVYQNGGFHESD